MATWFGLIKVFFFLKLAGALVLDLSPSCKSLSRSSSSLTFWPLLPLLFLSSMSLLILITYNCFQMETLLLDLVKKRFCLNIFIHELTWRLMQLRLISRTSKVLVSSKFLQVRHIIPLVIWHHLFLKFWSVNAWFFFHPRDQLL